MPKRRSSRLRSYTAPNHTRSADLSSTLSHELRDKYAKRSIRVRKGDTVKVMRGEYAAIEGKIINVDVGSGKISVEGVTREKIKGGAVPIKIHASKVMVTALNTDDKLRREKLETAK